jgi:uncharacterized protein YukE
MDPLSLLDIPGGDPAAMRAQAGALMAAADETRRLAAALDSRVRATPYAGPSARGFRLRMTDHHAEALRVGAGLEQLAHRLVAHARQVAAEQDAVAAALRAAAGSL